MMVMVMIMIMMVVMRMVVVIMMVMVVMMVMVMIMMVVTRMVVLVIMMMMIVVVMMAMMVVIMVMMMMIIIMIIMMIMKLVIVIIMTIKIFSSFQQPGTCDIDFQCFINGDIHPKNRCFICTASNPHKWSPREGVCFTTFLHILKYLFHSISKNFSSITCPLFVSISYLHYRQPPSSIHLPNSREHNGICRRRPLIPGESCRPREPTAYNYSRCSAGSAHREGRIPMEA